MIEANKNLEDFRRPSAKQTKTVPTFLNPRCTKCNAPLFLTDILDDQTTPINKIWFDEWTCSNKNCKCHKYVLLDWNW